MSRGTLDPAAHTQTSGTGLSPSFAGLSSAVPLSLCVASAVRTPECTHSGLGSSNFARRYFRNRSFFLFLRLLRCFSSPGSPPYTMDSCMDTWSLSMWVSPFRYPRLTGYLLLPAAFRSLSRLSSALSAKASTLRPFLLNLWHPFQDTLPRCPLHSVAGSLSGSFYFFCFCSRHVLSMAASDVLSFRTACFCRHFYRCGSLYCRFYFDILILGIRFSRYNVSLLTVLPVIKS